MTLHDKVVKRPEVVAHTQHRVSRPRLGEACENKEGILSYLDEMPLIGVFRSFRMDTN